MTHLSDSLKVRKSILFEPESGRTAPPPGSMLFPGKNVLGRMQRVYRVTASLTSCKSSKDYIDPHGGRNDSFARKDCRE